MNPHDHTQGLASMNEVEHLTQLSKTTIWRREQEGEFPRRIQISKGRVAWHRSEIFDWIAERSVGQGRRTCLKLAALIAVSKPEISDEELAAVVGTTEAIVAHWRKSDLIFQDAMRRTPPLENVDVLIHSLARQEGGSDAVDG